MNNTNEAVLRDLYKWMSRVQFKFQNDEVRAAAFADQIKGMVVDSERAALAATATVAKDGGNIDTSNITSAIRADDNKFKLIFKSKAACEKFQTQLYASIYDGAPKPEASAEQPAGEVVPIGYVVGEYFDARRPEYDLNGTVMYAQKSGMATTPVYLAAPISEHTVKSEAEQIGWGRNMLMGVDIAAQTSAGDALVPLPKAERELIELHQPTTYTTHVCTSARYSADQMHAYAKACVEADRTDLYKQLQEAQAECWKRAARITELEAARPVPATASIGEDAARELDLYDEIECDLPHLFGRAAKEGHDASQQLANEVRSKMRAARTAASRNAGVVTFQSRVQPWMMACFGAEISADRQERNHRFFEEATELVQATGMTANEAHQLVDYVFGRDVGEPAQEVGGVMVTLAALCLAQGMDMAECGETELARIWTKVEAIRAKQAAKPKHSPLPMTAAPESAEPSAYDELIYAVGSKYPGESRHQTALRYIRERETLATSSAAKGAK